jgi:hypothetical protein
MAARTFLKQLLAAAVTADKGRNLDVELAPREASVNALLAMIPS